MMAADDWLYRAEGNNNVVFTNISNSCILRLPKIRMRNRTRKTTQQLRKKAFAQEIDFLEHVVPEMLKDVRVRYRGEKIILTKEFINQLSRKMVGKRPRDYEGELLDESIECGMLFPNFCNFLPLNNINLNFPFSKLKYRTGPVISIELRPKTCYVPALESGFSSEIHEKCFFCLSRLYRELINPDVLQTKYCPNDMYSGNTFRVRRAVQDLISCPERHFSVRVNDHVVYSNLVLAKKFSEAFDFSGSRRKFNRQVFDQVVLFHFGENGKEIFFNLVCASLWSSVMVGQEEKDKFGQRLSTARPHCRRRTSSNEETNQKSKDNLQNYNILAFLASVRSLQKLPLHTLVKMHDKIKSHLENHKEDSNALSLGSPYNVLEWQNATKLLGVNGCNGEKNNSHQSEIIESAEILRQYIISRSFSCCSVIITLQKVQQGENYNHKAKNNGLGIVSDGFGQTYHSLISIIDLDKDLPAPVEKFYNREQEIITYLNNYFSKTSKT